MAELTTDSHDPRPPLEPRSDLANQIAIYHPVRQGPLLAFGRRQKVIENSQERLGIRHWFVLDACLVVAGKGFLSSTPDSTGRVDIAESGFLTGREYWYFLSDAAADPDYRICNNFLEWKPLTREEVPQRWFAIDERDGPTTVAPLLATSSDISLFLKITDGYCAISGLNEELRACHLYACNTIYKQFSHDDACFGFASNSRPVDDIRQILTLESGLHDSMDRPSFVIAPSPPSDEYVCFFFANRPIGLAEDYHMRTARVPSRIQGYALFARFAWAMINSTFALPLLQTPMKKGKRKQATDLPADHPDQSPPRRRRRSRSGGGAGLDTDCPTIHTASDSDLSFDDADCDTDDSLSNIHDVSDGGRLELGSAPIDYLKEQEQQLTASQIQRFHDAEEGIKPFSSFLYNSLEYYPGYSHIDELKKSYVVTHPAVSETGDPSTATRTC
ncbi:hypothetical protein EDD18DRAFT_1463487 [Armillaria luteobubalina]|uniref:HNH nuclease domain-containing protein n=1 Tax=Armillaria luteobubalina TaxID=153913 RepID=A0AA39UWC4_9AGAR|nr:hypothetical protein EDD18DRAFT_1463487 [Armillaria luteobubalina]